VPLALVLAALLKTTLARPYLPEKHKVVLKASTKIRVVAMPPKKRKATEALPESEATRRVTRSSTTANAPAPQTSTGSSKAGPKDSKTAKDSAKGNQKSKGAKPTSATITEPDAAKEAKSKNSENDAASTHGKAESISIDSKGLVKKSIECALYNPPTPRAVPTLIFTHGAGGTLSAPAVVNFCNGFCTARPVLVFQGSMNLASRVKGFHACIENVDEEKGDVTHLVLGGRSMGARAAVMAAAEVLEQDEEAAVKLVLVSYPLQGPKDVRDHILLSLPASVNVLFVIGDRDAMCPLDLLNDVRSKMEAKSQLVVVQGADHGMHTKPTSVEQEVGEQSGIVAASWLAGNVQEEVSYIGSAT
jgi:predicted alpha/beta-hydrolase family hydrolase